MTEALHRPQDENYELDVDSFVIHHLETHDPDVVKLLVDAQAQGRDVLAFAEQMLEVGARMIALGSTDQGLLMVERAVKDANTNMDRSVRGLQDAAKLSVDELLQPEGKLQRGIAGIFDKVKVDLEKNLAGEDAPIRKLIADRLAEVQKQVTENVGRSLVNQKDEIAKLLDVENAQSPLRSIRQQITELHEAVVEVSDHVKKSETVAEVAENTTMKGGTYEDAATAALQKVATLVGDTCEATGNTTGLVRNSKRGDAVSSFMGATGATLRVVMEAKNAKLQTKEWLDEAKHSRKNRGAIGFLGLCKNAADMPSPGQRMWVSDMRTIVLAFDPDQDDVTVLAAVYQLLKLSVLTRSGQVDENSIAVVAEHLNNTLEKLNKFDDADRQVSSIKTATKKLEDVLADLRDEIGTELKSAQRALQSTEASDESGDLDEDLAE
jgi:hypothetical protein